MFQVSNLMLTPPKRADSKNIQYFKLFIIPNI